MSAWLVCCLTTFFFWLRLCDAGRTSDFVGEHGADNVEKAGPVDDLVEAVEASNAAKVTRLLQEHQLQPCALKNRLLCLVQAPYVDRVNEAGKAALHSAVHYATTDITKLLLENRARPDVKDKRGFTPLHYAAQAGNGDAVKLLVSSRAKLDRRAGNAKHTPLTIAIRAGHLSASHLLLELNADPNSKSNQGESPAGMAIRFGHEDILTELAKHGADMNHYDRYGYSILMHAVQDRRMMKVVLDYGANLTSSDGDERVYDYCVKEGISSAVEEFCDRGLKPTFSDCDAAVGVGHTSVVEVLLNKGVQVNDLKPDRSTLLHSAVSAGHSAVVTLLLNRRADLTVEDDRQMTPFDVAKASAAPSQIVDLLVSHSAITHAIANVRTVCDFVCDEDHDPILLSPFDGEVVVRIGQKCLIVRSLLEWLTRRETNPYTGLPYTMMELSEEVQRVNDDGSPSLCRMSEDVPSSFGDSTPAL
eukprot:TRINITY_DN8685_c0_g1_i1.p1 TRINITY_DN8685_c0_g1~~TRINITY_DN8685_c0_g1_i1.p1  ORF type:complete len:474 (+),score=70.91 TRINITY_DN8685_c0_g1_i1:39-1460(+)